MYIRNLLIGLAVLLIFMIVSPPKTYSPDIVDVSWPNCNNPLTTTYKEGIIGVNGGLDFKPNPCVAKEASWIANYQLYMNTGYPGTSYGLKFKSSPKDCASNDQPCLAYNYGYNAAVYSINYAASNNVHAAVWWLDVETDNSWTSTPAVNKQVLQGALMAVKQHVLFSSAGFYSVNDQWDLLTGSWRNGTNEWLGSGALSAAQAKNACSTATFTGGQIIYSQYTTNIDINVRCN